MMKRVLFVGALVVVACAGLLLMLRPAPRAEEAIVAERNVTAWSRLAQVREPVATLHYGERVLVTERKGGQAYVRTPQGQLGWMDARHLMDPQLWGRIKEQAGKARLLPVQATGKTRVPTNVRVDPGRNAPRIYQFERDVPVEIVARAVAEWTQAADETPGSDKDSPSRKAPAPPAKESNEAAEPPKKEDWLLVRGKEVDAGDISGWVLGRFLEPGLPDPLKDYGAGIRFAAWFELARVPENLIERAGDPVTGLKAIYLGAGVIGGEGQPCDFTLIRVYTWNQRRHRYETAYVESNLCGHFPIRVTPAAAPEAEAVFQFVARGKSGADEQREYRMKQNVVRRVQESLRKPARK